MVKSKTIYRGEKRCEITHEPSLSKIETDAPKDNHGLGEKFSPTDLLGAALASCVLTTIAIFAEREGLSLLGCSAEVEKVMTPAPRRIQSLALKVQLPSQFTAAQRLKYEEIARTCPVHCSLHPDVQIHMTFIYS